ncbi:hypothetical protein [Pseudonocardia sp.]|jgi:hypothetical protein|uniref:hypothetical protein n=1 Tax=Pseudonocardia sp. TaxID=60912 RepID=UPI002F41AF29
MMISGLARRVIGAVSVGMIATPLAVVTFVAAGSPAVAGPDSVTGDDSSGTGAATACVQQVRDADDNAPAPNALLDISEALRSPACRAAHATT